MFITKEMVQEMLDDDPSLATLKNQFTLEEIWEKIEEKEEITDDEELYNALMDVMYATRPKGVT